MPSIPSFSVPALSDRVESDLSWQSYGLFRFELEWAQSANHSPRYRLVVHSPDGETTRIFQGEEVAPLTDWAIAAQPPLTLEIPACESETPPPLPQVVMERLRLQAPNGSDAIATPSQPYFSGTWLSPTAIAFQFRIVGLTPEQVNQHQIGYQVYLYARDCLTLATTQMGQSQIYPILSTKSIYQAELDDLEVLTPGRYRLQALVTVNGLQIVPGYFEIPLLTII
ncbi:MAG: hypothetical protein ACLFV6_06760 [Spirulinaceae cyanobacterium]